MNEITKYVVVGVVNTFIGYVVFLGALHWIGCAPAAANAFGYLIALSISFLLNRRFVFPKSRPVGHAAWRFTVAFFIAFSLNQFVLFMLLREFLLSVDFAQILAMATYTLSFYLLSKYFVFGTEKSHVV